MSSAPQQSDPGWVRLVLRRTDQAVAAVLTAVALVAIAGWCLWQGELRGRLIDIERAEPAAADFKIDVNAAEWKEFALLPGIGEQLAKRIVAEREGGGEFRKVTDLRRVRGIGAKTLEEMRPYLLPLEEKGAESRGKETGVRGQ